jgi:hypothetical protein
MASGDAQRAWFPEMLSILRQRWHPTISWEEVGRICDDMQRLRKEIRERKNIRPVRIYCKECGQYSEVVPPRISIRSLLFALRKANIVTDAEFKALDKNWKKYRKENSLDLFGRKAE